MQTGTTIWDKVTKLQIALSRIRRLIESRGLAAPTRPTATLQAANTRIHLGAPPLSTHARAPPSQAALGRQRDLLAPSRRVFAKAERK